MIKTIATGLAVFLGIVLLFALIALLIGFPVMWLWNACLVGAVAGISPIGFWQAVGLTFLCSILFNSSSSSSSK